MNFNPYIIYIHILTISYVIIIKVYNVFIKF